MTYSIDELTDRFRFLESCCMHEAQWHPRDVAEVLAWRDGEPDGDAEIVVVALADGSFGTMISSEDYTGHGCQCDSYTVREASLEAAKAHLTEAEQRELFGN